MQSHQSKLTINTQPYSIINITDEISGSCQSANISSGLCHLFVRHTSCSLIISENCDPDVLHDLKDFMKDLVPESSYYRHSAEGLDDMPAHIRSVLTQTEMTIPIMHGQLALGRWQALYLWEHRAQQYNREVIISIMGE